MEPYHCAVATSSVGAPAPIRVFITHAIRLYREGLEQLLDKEVALKVVGSSGSPEEAIVRIGELSPDVAVLDVGMAQGLAMARALRATNRAIKTVALAVAEVESEVTAWAEAGMSGYVTREGSLRDLVETIERAWQGEILCPPRIAATLLDRLATLANSKWQTRPDFKLTLREVEVAQLLGEGLSNLEIARRLSIALPTVKNHVHNILEKLKVRSRRDAVALLGSAASNWSVRVTSGPSPALLPRADC
ncbi:MAG: hypothetical protein QOH66_1542 [Actinomycetota bacterium]|nr:hypothetical protein [Actinomycetota bacterium]